MTGQWKRTVQFFGLGSFKTCLHLEKELVVSDTLLAYCLNEDSDIIYLNGRRVSNIHVGSTEVIIG